MILDEAIKHHEEVAQERQKTANIFRSLKDFNNPKSTIKHGYEKCLGSASEHRQLAELLKELKQLREQTSWIPVSERLPKEGGDYFTTISFDIGAKEPVIEVCKNFFCVLSQKWLNRDEDVIAWMPLLEPYKAESEG